MQTTAIVLSFTELPHLYRSDFFINKLNTWCLALVGAAFICNHSCPSQYIGLFSVFAVLLLNVTIWSSLLILLLVFYFIMIIIILSGCLYPWSSFWTTDPGFLKLFYFWFYNCSPLKTFVPLELLQYSIGHVNIALIYIKFVFFARTFYRGVSSFATVLAALRDVNWILASCMLVYSLGT